jgi:hypothetical protein
MEALLPAPAGAGRFVIRATRERNCQDLWMAWLWGIVECRLG